MKLEDLKVFSDENNETGEKKNKITVGNAIDLLKRFYNEISDTVNEYSKQDAYNKYRFKGFISYTFNNYSQVFMDLMDLILIKSGKSVSTTSLRRYCREYDAMFTNKTINEKEILAYLVMRNDIIHDYINYELNMDEEFLKFYNYVDGLLDIAERLYDYFDKQDMLGGAL